MKKYIYLLAGLFILAAACRKSNSEAAGAALSVSNFWPNSGNAGTIVTIKGQGFGRSATDNEVNFNGAAGKVVDVSDSTLIVLTPETGKSGVLTLKVAGKMLELGNYTYQDLSLQGVSPLNGPAGTNISIHGKGFSSLSAPAQVMINGKSAVVTGATDTLLVAAVPVAAGSGRIVVTVDGKQVTGPDFSFQNISSIKPVTGGAGTSVTINGEGFGGGSGNIVSFNGKPAAIVSAQGNQLVVTAPAGVETGPVSVMINGQKTIGNVFTVVPMPVLKTVAPLSGPAGTQVVISGQYFSDLPDEVTVSFNGRAATVVSATTKQLTVQVPAGSGTGNISVLVNGQQTPGPVFKEQTLGVSQLIPDNGLAGTVVMVQGIGFSTTLTDNVVSFNGILARVSNATSTELTVIAPTGFTTGTVNVKVAGLEGIGPVFKRAGVMTVAGGPSLNVINYPAGVTVDKQGNVYVSDANLIRKITSSGVVSVFAGDPAGAGGLVDGVGTQALFTYPGTLGIDAQDNIYVCDIGNKSIRKITPSGVVSTYSKLGFTPTGLGVDRSGAVYVGTQYGPVVKLDAFGNPTQLSKGYESPTSSIAVDNAGLVYYTADYSYNVVFRISGGVRSPYAGSSYGFRDGPVATAMFGTPTGIVFDPGSGSLYLTDNNALRMIAEGQVTTITGWNGGMSPVSGYRDGTLKDAQFSGITGLCLDGDGNIYVVERNNKTLRKIILK
jgi:IPT/TIG domain-containing protein